MSITGDRIRELRQRNHLTLDDVARHCNVGRQAIYKYEQGTVTNIPLKNLEIMANLFGTTPEYLSGWTDDASPEGSTKRRIPIVVPNSEQFVKLAENMSAADYETVMSIFEKTYNKLKERGEI